MDGEQLCEEVWSRFESSIHDPVVGINELLKYTSSEGVSTIREGGS